LKWYRRESVGIQEKVFRAAAVEQDEQHTIKVTDDLQPY